MKIVTFGEIMLRLAPEGYLRFAQAEKFNATYGGGEANVAVSLSILGKEAEFVTKLPKNELGDAAIASLNRYGVATKNIARGGTRVGIYFLEKGAGPRPSKVIYDRAASAIAEASPSDFDWEKIFEGASWFHFTGISPALSDGTAEILKTALKAAKNMGLTVSCDLNYRKKLWSKERARAVMTPLMDYVDVLIANEEDAADVFSISAAGANAEAGNIEASAYAEVAGKLIEAFGFKYVGVTLRKSISASDNLWQALLSDGKAEYISKQYSIRIVDRVGGGDSFAAGLIFALSENFPPKLAVEFAAAASCLKHTIEGDFNLSTKEEIFALMEGGGTGRVQR
ncbi:MAG TPA: sugar kinase [Eubacteriales bacterium]|jgi:2-dehydro-3-deoxygluconokinase|nr:sugar kinase [Clostridia bacterium]HRR90049.1 sugar kinase [Eubacteriales bacterium]HRU83915.1 sugar kinase [Eubacteriales bacterium]